MLDDLRNSAAHSFNDDFPADDEGGKHRDPVLILGMTAQQRFLVSVLLLIMTCAIGALLLVAFGKVYI
ncbi:MAG: hypothetical protein ACYC3H_01475 [Bellilinea sp.]